MAKMQNKPSMMVCYLCGQQFGTASLAIHQPQCYQKQLAWWQQNDPATRGPKPKDPAVHGHNKQDKMSAKDIQEFNEQNFENYNSNLSACPNCGRTFAPDRLPVHLRSCNPGNSGGGSKPVNGKTPPGNRPSSSPGRKSSSASPARSKGVKPEMLVCYLCGQQFGSSSLAIHQPQCYQKQMTWWKNGDPATRGPKPKDPATYAGSAQNAGNMQDKEAYNQAQFENYNANLSPCPHCGRTFAADRLAVHLRSCNPNASGGGSKPVAGHSRPSGGGDGSKPGSPGGGDKRQPGARPSMLVCYLCGQQFGSKSLGIHQPQCYKKKMAEWERGEPATRGPKPRDPATQPQGGAGNGQAMSADEFNQQQFEMYNSNLSACPNCGRTFNADRLAVHMKSCNPGASGGGSKRVGDGAKPRTPGSSVSGGGGGGGGGAPPPQPGASQQHKRSPLVSRLPSNASKPQEQTCSACGTANDPDARFCEECGQNIGESPPPAPLPPPTAPPLVCTQCGAQWDSGKFCQECGGSLQAPAQQEDADPGPEAEPEMRCPACGELCPASGNFCEECGEPLNKRSPMKNRLPSDASGGGGGGGGGSGWRGATTSEFPSVPDESYRPGATAQTTQNGPPPSYKEATGGRQVPSAPQSEEAEDAGGDDDDGGGGGGAMGGVDEYDDGGVSLSPCSICGRRFATERLAKHEQICVKSSQKKRRVFNSTKARAPEGVDAVSFATKGSKAEVKKEKVDWKSKSNAFREAMKQARDVKACMEAGKPLPPPTYTREEDDTRTPCPHCSRKFAPDVAERHIPKCATTVNKARAPPKRPVSNPSSPVPARGRGASGPSKTPPPSLRRQSPAGQGGPRTPNARGSAPQNLSVDRQQSLTSPDACSPMSMMSQGSDVPPDVARMGVTQEKWDKIQAKHAAEWEDAFAEGPTNVQPCPHCNRKFVPNSLAIHLKSCGGRHGTSKKVYR